MLSILQRQPLPTFFLLWERARENPRRKLQSFITYWWKWHAIISAIYYWLHGQILKHHGRRPHKSMSTRRWWSWGSLEMGYHSLRCKNIFSDSASYCISSLVSPPFPLISYSLPMSWFSSVQSWSVPPCTQHQMALGCSHPTSSLTPAASFRSTSGNALNVSVAQ